tara:strand:+ start:5382 stop:6236 length:855 start_codon:yes stop_codon:yes gene_type:complete
MKYLFDEDKEFKDFMETWDFPLDIKNPIRKSPKNERIEYLREIARQTWNYCIENGKLKNKKKEYKDKRLKVDVVLLSVIDKELSVLLLKRSYEPFKGKWALPGGYIPENMSADKAAELQLEKKTGIKGAYLEQLGLFSEEGRDPSGDIASMAYLSLVDSSKITTVKTEHSVGFQWVKVSELPDLAYDHEKIVKLAEEKLIEKIRTSKLGFELAGEKFTLKQLITVLESITGVELDQSNVRKKLQKLKILKDTGEKVVEGRGRPSPVFVLDKEAFSKLSRWETLF